MILPPWLLPRSKRARYLRALEECRTELDANLAIMEKAIAEGRYWSEPLPTVAGERFLRLSEKLGYGPSGTENG